MSLLVTIWTVSLAAMVGIYWYAATRASVSRVARAPKDLTELMTREIQHLNADFGQLLRDIRPHGVRAVRAGLIAVKRGNDLIISRVYGRMSVEKGKASSFFLKQIAEHKEGGKDMPKGL